MISRHNPYLKVSVYSRRKDMKFIDDKSKIVHPLTNSPQKQYQAYTGHKNTLIERKYGTLFLINFT